MYMFDNRISIENRGIIEEYLNGYEYRTSDFLLHPSICGVI